MTLIPQPLSDVSAPPLSEAAIISQKKWKWLWIVGIGSILGFLVPLLLTPFMIRVRRIPPQTQAVNNARQIGIALIEFQEEFGQFPSPSTIAKLRSESGTLLSIGAVTSNDFFRQLLASGIVESEPMFYRKRQLPTSRTTFSLELWRCKKVSVVSPIFWVRLTRIFRIVPWWWHR